MSIAILILLVLLAAAPASAQEAQQAPPLTPEAQQLTDQLREVGCRAERVTAAQTIDQLQKKIAELQKQIGDPPAAKPRSGATKH